MGQPYLKAQRDALAGEQIEIVGKNLCDMMPWVAKNQFVNQEEN